MNWSKRKKKRNNAAIIMGIISIIVFVLVSRYTYTLRDIRINGELIYAPIVNIRYYGHGRYADVLIDGKELDARGIGNNLRVGDTIAVRYIKGKPRVAQESDKLSGYYLLFALSSALLILGVCLIVGGFMGKR